jgi:hypothetical protein
MSTSARARRVLRIHIRRMPVARHILRDARHILRDARPSLCAGLAPPERPRAPRALLACRVASGVSGAGSVFARRSPRSRVASHPARPTSGSASASAARSHHARNPSLRAAPVILLGDTADLDCALASPPALFSPDPFAAHSPVARAPARPVRPRNTVWRGYYRSPVFAVCSYDLQ